MKKRGLNLPKARTVTGPALLWRRVIAFLADVLIVNLVIFFPFKKIIQKSIPAFTSYSEAYKFISANRAYNKTLTVISLVMFLFAFLYFAGRLILPLWSTEYL